jgi:hypothetical protein
MAQIGAVPPKEKKNGTRLRLFHSSSSGQRREGRLSCSFSIGVKRFKKLFSLAKFQRLNQYSYYNISRSAVPRCVQLWLETIMVFIV